MTIRAISTVTAAIRIQTHLWLRWATIAKRFAGEARSARTELEGEREKGQPLSHMQQELEASMIAISAVAHTIDGLYGEIRDLAAVPQTTRDAWRAKRTPRESQILETLKIGFNVGRKSERWTAEFEWLFDLRDAALHHAPRSRDTVAHPMGGTHVSPEYADYCCENAARAIALLTDVIETCITAPRPALAEWASEKHASAVAIGVL